MSLIAFVTTDEDIAERAAGLLGGNRVHLIQPREDHWKLAYSYRVRGRRAVSLMKQLRPLMGQRRRLQIDKAIESWKEHRTEQTKLDDVDKDRKTIKARVKAGKAHQEVADEFGIDRTYVSKIVNDRV